MSAHAEPRAELVEIVARAHRLGYCHRRVATALDASDQEIAVIEQRIMAVTPLGLRRP